MTLFRSPAFFMHYLTESFRPLYILVPILEKNEIIQSAFQNLKVESLNLVQEAVLKQDTGRKDVILLSPTGLGRALAHPLPLLSALKPNGDNVQVLILVPLRELALQVDTMLRSMGTSWKTCCCYGGYSIAGEKKSTAGSHSAIIPGTPGCITDHLSRGNFGPEIIEILVTDEFGESLEFGFHDEMAGAITRLPGLKKRMLLPVTDAGETPQFMGLNRTAKLGFLSEATKEQENRLKSMKVFSPSRGKTGTLCSLFHSPESSSSIILCNHRNTVDRVHKLFKGKRLLAERSHGSAKQPGRERALYKLRNGSCHVLVSTDLATCGLDIPEIEHIIYYHLPVSEEAFTHHNERTACWDTTGTSYLIPHAEKKLPEYIPKDMETMELLGSPSCPPKSVQTTIYMGKGEKEKLSRMDIAGSPYKKGNLTREDVSAIDVKEYYVSVAVRRTKAERLLNLTQGEKIRGVKAIIKEAK